MNSYIKQGDCLELLQDVESESIDLILTDLPYGVLNKSNKHATWDKPLDLDQLWAHWKRVLKPSGTVVLFGQGMFTAKVMMSNQKMWRYNLIWDKERVSGFLNANRQPLRCHEDIMVFGNGGGYLPPTDGTLSAPPAKPQPRQTELGTDQPLLWHLR